MNDDYSLYWFIDAHSNMITFQMIASTTGWFAMALSPREALADGAITVCSLNNNKNNSLSLSNWYAIKDNAKPAYGPFNFATPVASHYNSVEKKSSCTFTRSLQAQHPYYDRSIINDTVHVLWAFGQKKELSDHGKNRGSVRLNLMGGPIEPPKSNVMKAVLLWVHGGLMFFAWGLCSTVGIYFSRFGRVCNKHTLEIYLQHLYSANSHCGGSRVTSFHLLFVWCAQLLVSWSYSGARNGSLNFTSLTH